MVDSNPNEVADCLKKLCQKICRNEGSCESAFRTAVALVSVSGESSCSSNEEYVCQRIRDKILARRSQAEANKFTDHYQRLKGSLVLQKRCSVLSLLLSLSGGEEAGRGASRGLHMAAHRMPCAPATSDTTMRHTVSLSSFGSVDSQYCTGSAPLPAASTINGSIRKTSHSMQSLTQHKHKNNEEECELSEHELLQAVLYLAQGVQGAHSAGCLGGRRGRGALAARLAELGFLHDKVAEITSNTNPNAPIGVVGQGLISAFHNELSEYYRSIAIVQSELNSSTPGQAGALTLRRLFVWATEPLHRLKWLAIIGYNCQNKKGGELASAVYEFLCHGDPRVSGLVSQLLPSVCYPLYVMLCRWLLDGELEDQHSEFFIEGRSTSCLQRLWHDKYKVRTSMLPAFISRTQAEHILATGKSVTFLREVCGDHGHLAERETLKRVLDDSSAELLFSGGPSAKLQSVMSMAYLGVSRRLLDALLNQHKLMKHLGALHAYLLLGQGDFIQTLMLQLQPELNKPASQLCVHNLTCILDASVRSTNAQYHDPDVLNRLHINMFPPSPEDVGWDVVSLLYSSDGPLGTLLQAEAAACYRTLFTHLWRAKRMEYTLGQMWRRHTVEYKTIAKMAEVTGLLRRLHVLRSEMVHLVKELQHALFVVVECGWQELMQAAGRAHALDQLLAAHHAFLHKVTASALLDDNTKHLHTYLSNIYSEILLLKEFESKLYARIYEEAARRKAIQILKDERGKKGEYGITKDEEGKHAEELKVFLQFINENKAELNVLVRTYRGHVKTFILKLALQNDSRLQFLLYRLDYNDFYKRGDSKLHEPLTYQHKRLSAIGLGGKQNGHRKGEQQMAARTRKIK